jgi:hypothetical protein
MRGTGFLRKHFYIFLVLLNSAVHGFGVTNNINPSVEYYFSGSARLLSDKNFSTLAKISAKPASAQFHDVILKRLSKFLGGGSEVEALLSDVVKSESMGCLNDSDFMLAAHFDAKRTAEWHDKLTKDFGDAGEQFDTEGVIGWHWKPLWIIPAGDWLLLGRGEGFQPLQKEYLQQIHDKGHPSSHLDTSGQPHLSVWLPDAGKQLQSAQIKIEVTGEGGMVHTTAEVTYPTGKPWRPAAWRLPKEMIRSPLISFTVAQDLAPFFDVDAKFTAIANNPLTNQFFIWAMGQMPLQTYMAWPVANATNALEKFASEAMTNFNLALKQLNGTELMWVPKYKRLVMSKLRVLGPALEAAQDATGQFLLVDMFPRSPVSQPAPAALWDELTGTTNLVYYDWEETGLRLQQWRLLGSMLLNRSPIGSDTTGDAYLAEGKWLAELSSAAGNTVTEVTRISPNELSLVRNGPLGLTGIEALLLSDWASGVGFGPINARPIPRSAKP